ncbi:M48 family metallopeptidase [Leptospira sp. 2 VSF19]|uniref:M48 family metallopeptidase n=1 Tax=Leptospira soteropolitanensis TaxID=2950025 RepID=A0AAW5VLP1_9LEPT|nr:M48 family metallopeptidase [Leptospira soteropolitanensis]MCW7492149.1 M48 family metallopeptidase [Leptospira soteropolitanensis]MCW7499731.1 M48 family metallopeptidase [Leptospira soteropolitanensis]MCW7521982.1 M48 family metallopeptidase [Leptospira soteropolitanensis]MCW7525836.1 M48 family metallopeptidase [Leptospira soteropolitanensis]MCW7530050.1 M48 family metallopeptidase [Leptospira soteropolitanensis]
MIRKLVFFLALTFLNQCSTSPTGRKQIILVNDAEMNEMGIVAFSEMKTKTPIDSATTSNQYVNCIVSAELAVTTDTTGVDSWEVVVFRDNTPNAFALPGGKIGVYTGMFFVAKNKDQLAAVIGHEIGHVIARHGNERVSQNQLAGGSVKILESLGKPTVAGALGLGAKFGVLLPFSREHESEADLIGLEIMAKSGFDPRQSVELWKNMSALGGSKTNELLSTHPSDATRMKNLNAAMPNALVLWEKAKAEGKRPNCQL